MPGVFFSDTIEGYTYGSYRARLAEGLNVQGSG